MFFSFYWTINFCSYYEDYLSAKFPFGFYKQVFLPPEIVVCSSALGASLSVFSSHVLYDERVIDQVLDPRNLACG